MLAKNINPGVSVPPNVETEICRWDADGTSYLIGFTATGSFSGEFILYVDDEPWYDYQTSPGNRTAYIADRGEKPVAGVQVSLRVTHTDTQNNTFKGTILGGQ